MSTVTAHILVGHSHQNHGGISSSHVLFLSENSRPAWILIPLGFPGSEPNTEFDSITWIPTVEHMLEDALLMIAVHVLRERTLVERFQRAVKKQNTSRLELYDDLESVDRESLYQQCRTLDVPHTLVLTVLEGSTIRSQLPVLETFKMDIDVCLPTYSRHYSAWSEKTDITGSLK